MSHLISPADTANLASILTVQQQVPAISSLDDVVEEGILACIYEPLASQVIVLNPKMANLMVRTAYGEEGRALHAGRCGVLILSELHAKDYADGVYHAADCAALDQGALSAEQAQCKRDSSGAPVGDRDCGFVKVGDLLFAQPTSYPVSRELPSKVFHALAFMLYERRRDGAFQSSLQKFEALDSQSQCTKTEDRESLRLKPESLAGTIFFCVFLAVAGVGHATVKKAVSRQRSKGKPYVIEEHHLKGARNSDQDDRLGSDSAMLRQLLQGQRDLIAHLIGPKTPNDTYYSTRNLPRAASTSHMSEEHQPEQVKPAEISDVPDPPAFPQAYRPAYVHACLHMPAHISAPLHICLCE